MISRSYGNFYVALEAFLLPYIYPLPCPSVRRYSRAGYALWCRFWGNRKKVNEDLKYAIFLKKFKFFSILISEFQKEVVDDGINGFLVLK